MAFGRAAAVDYANRHAEAGSVGKCAAYVRRAVQWGGIPLQHSPHAKDLASMKHLSSWGVVAFSMLLAVTSPKAGELQDQPEARVRAFYSWFIRNDTDTRYPLRQQAIEQYGAQATVERLRHAYSHGGPPGDVDYFLKVQDYDPKDWGAHIAINPAVRLGDVAVVAVTFGSTEKVSVVVFLRRSRGVWTITKVGDTEDFQ